MIGAGGGSRHILGGGYATPNARGRNSTPPAGGSGAPGRPRLVVEGLRPIAAGRRKRTLFGLGLSLWHGFHDDRQYVSAKIGLLVILVILAALL